MKEQTSNKDIVIKGEIGHYVFCMWERVNSTLFHDPFMTNQYQAKKQAMPKHRK